MNENLSYCFLGDNYQNLSSQRYKGVRHGE
jgi:hypothetical protein